MSSLAAMCAGEVDWVYRSRCTVTARASTGHIRRARSGGEPVAVECGRDDGLDLPAVIKDGGGKIWSGPSARHDNPVTSCCPARVARIAWSTRAWTAAGRPRCPEIAIRIGVPALGQQGGELPVEVPHRAGDGPGVGAAELP